MSQSFQNVDCRVAMREVRDDSIDAVVFDPPYSERVHDGQVRERRGKAPGSAGVQEHEVEYGAIDDLLRCTLAHEAARVARSWVVVCSDVEGVAAWRHELELAGLAYIRTVPWIKRGAQPQKTGDRPAASFEVIVLAHSKRRRVRWYNNPEKPLGGGRALWYDHAVERKALVTGQKPLALMVDIVRDFTAPGAMVLDPTAGMATTLVACQMLGRPCIGYERDPDTFRKAKARLERAVALQQPAQEI